MPKQNVPALRLKGFNGEWEVSPLSEVSELNPSASVPAHFEYVDLASVLGTEMISHQSTSSSEAPSRAQRVARYGDIFYQTVRPYQKNNYHFMIDSDCDFVFSTGYAQIRPLIDGEFLFTAVQREDFLVQVLDRCTGTGYPAIAPNALGKIQLSYPPTLEEQQTIGAIFTNLEASINQHARKHKSLQQAKTALMQKMFPQEGQTVPELRLEGFDGEWGTTTVSAVADVVGGGTPSTSNPSLWDGDIDWYSPNEVGSDVVAKPSNRRVTVEGLRASSAQLLPAHRTILYTSRASIGHTAILKHPATTNQGFQSLVLRDGMDTYFMYSLTPLITRKALKISSGSTFLEISAKTLGTIEIPIPATLEEQQAIGAVFTNLDQLIAAEAQYVASLKQAKTALLQRMFI